MKNRQKIALKILSLSGWKFEGSPEAMQLWKNTQKCILIVAPHTSITDYIIGYMALTALGKKATFLINKKFFFFPLNIILKSHGGIPVNAGKDKAFLQNIAEQLNTMSQMFITITPEGTRKKTTRWRRGFHQLACATKLPLLLGALDYKKKQIILGTCFTVSSYFEKDIKEIGKFYLGVSGKHPTKFALPTIS